MLLIHQNLPQSVDPQLLLWDEGQLAAVSARLDGEPCVVIARRQDHTWYPWQAGKFASEIDSVAVRKPDVDERGPRPQVPGDFERAGRVRRRSDCLDSHLREEPGGQSQKVRIIIDNEYRSWHPGIIAARRRARGRDIPTRGVR